MAPLSTSRESRLAAPDGRRRLLLRRLCATIALAGVGSGAPVAAWAEIDQTEVDEAAAALERSVKAAFVFKFAGFVEWPEQAMPRADTPIRIGVMGEESIVREIGAAASSRNVEGRRVLVKRIEPGDTLEGVHILFMRDPAFRRLADEIAGLEPEPMLIVTESPDALAAGSIINFIVDDGRVRFDLSLEAAERRGLKLSSRLITVARQVHGRPR